MRPAVFLDRDGVINGAFVRGGKPYPPMTMHEFKLLPGVATALEDLSAAGFALLVVTNQPDVRTGRQSLGQVEAFHAHLLATLPIDDVYTCYHIDQDGCNCRKPKPGLLFDAAKQHEVSLARSFMIGDRWRDIHAGAAAGCTSFLIDHGYEEIWPAQEPVAFECVSSLSEASARILEAYPAG